ncbi:cytochrome b [Pseudomonas asiatica]|uniref:cytochrome b n=1 Tax=Pseudomonas asiatica TaxID=2219225 RepID=UPI003839F413
MAAGTSYTPVAKGFHWVSGLIWIAAWWVGLVAVHWRDELNQEHSLTFLHKALASILIFLVMLRVAWRLTHTAPRLPNTMSPAMQYLALVGHVLLYVVALIALPLSGWYWSSVADKTIMVAGVFKLPSLVQPDESCYGVAKMVHTYIAWLCGLLIFGHIGAALKHHFLDKDSVLKDMLPRR